LCIGGETRNQGRFYAESTDFIGEFKVFAGNEGLNCYILMTRALQGEAEEKRAEKKLKIILEPNAASGRMILAS
jgi:hypothetical protein